MYYLLLLLLMVLFPLLYLRYAKKMSGKKTLATLFPPLLSAREEILGSLALAGALIIGYFVIIAGITVTEDVLSFVTGAPVILNDLYKVGYVIDTELTLGLENLIIILIVVLFVEEFFFRAFLTPRIGVLFSTVLFTIAHIGYESIAQTIGVFFLGLILAYWYKKRKSLVQNYVGHFLYDLFAIVFYVLAGV